MDVSVFKMEKVDPGQLLMWVMEEAGYENQAEFAHAIGVSPSYISLVKNGQRTLSERLVRRIEESHAPHVSWRHIELLRRSVALQEMRSRYDIDLVRDSLSSVDRLLEDLRTLGRKGETRGAIEILPGQIQELRELREKYPTDKKRIDQRIAMAHVQRLWAICLTSARRHIGLAAQEDLAALKQAAKSLAEAERSYYDRAVILPGLVAYVGGNFGASRAILSETLDQVESSEAKAVAARALAVGTARQVEQGDLGHQDGLSLYRHDVQTPLEAAENISSADGRAAIYAGLGFGRTLLGQARGAGKFLEVAHAAIEKAKRDGSFSQITRIQIARTDLLRLMGDEESDPRDIIANAEHCFSDFDRYQLIRYPDRILRGLRTHSNREVREYAETIALP